MEQTAPLHYIGFWRRFSAYLIDGIILLVLLVPLYFIESFFQQSGSNSLLFIVGYAIVFIVYFSLFEGSSKQATIGKMLLNLKVVTNGQNKITFRKALLRSTIKFVSVFTVILAIASIILMVIDEKKLSVHDYVLKTEVVSHKQDKTFIDVLLTLFLSVVSLVLNIITFMFIGGIAFIYSIIGNRTGVSGQDSEAFSDTDDITFITPVRKSPQHVMIRELRPSISATACVSSGMRAVATKEYRNYIDLKLTMNVNNQGVSVIDGEVQFDKVLNHSGQRLHIITGDKSVLGTFVFDPNELLKLLSRDAEAAIESKGKTSSLNIVGKVTYGYIHPMESVVVKGIYSYPDSMKARVQLPFANEHIDKLELQFLPDGQSDKVLMVRTIGKVPERLLTLLFSQNESNESYKSFYSSSTFSSGGTSTEETKFPLDKNNINTLEFFEVKKGTLDFNLKDIKVKRSCDL